MSGRGSHAPTREPARPASQRNSGAFRVRTTDEPPASPARTVAGTTPLPQSPLATTKIAAFNPDAAPAAAASVAPTATAPQVIAPPMPEPEVETVNSDDEVFTDSTLARAALVITHDVESAFRISDRIALLDEKRITHVGTPDEFRRCTGQIKLGLPVSVALVGVAERLKLQDFDVFVSTVRLHQTTGGNLRDARPLDRPRAVLQM